MIELYLKTLPLHILWFYNSTEQVGQKTSLTEQRNSPKHVTKNKAAQKPNPRIKSKIL